MWLMWVIGFHWVCAGVAGIAWITEAKDPRLLACCLLMSSGGLLMGAAV